MGVFRIIDGLNNPAQHVARASRLVAPFPEAISLPPDIGEVINSPKSISPDKLVHFWARRLEDIGDTKRRIIA